MTVQSSVNVVYLVGDGANKVFNYSFIITVAAHLEVSIDGVVQGSGYVVAGLAPTIGGTCTFTTAPASGAVVILRRLVPATQLIDYITGGAFPADSHELGLDLLTMYIQQLQSELDRAVSVPLVLSETVSAVLPTPVANAYIGWDATATGLTNISVVPAETAYTTGTWTPVLTWSGGSTGIVHGSQVGLYTRIGNLVYVQINLSITDHGSDTGAIRVSLPLTASAVVPPGLLQVLFSSWASTAVNVQAAPAVSTAYLEFRDPTAGTMTLMTNSDLDTSATIRVAGWYETV